jgi:hypothetical protein
VPCPGLSSRGAGLGALFLTLIISSDDLNSSTSFSCLLAVVLFLLFAGSDQPSCVATAA